MSNNKFSSSFHAFQNSTEDAWELDDDEFMNISPKVAQSTAQEVIDRHSREVQKQRDQESRTSSNHSPVASHDIPVRPSCPAVAVTTNRSRHHGPSSYQTHDVIGGQGLGPTRGTVGHTKTAPGMGIRLNSCHRSLSPSLPQQQAMDRQRLAKFKEVIQGPQTDLRTLRVFSWSGIPVCVRPTVWKLLCDYLPPSADRRAATLTEKRRQYFNFVRQYFHMRETAANADMFHQIQKDLMRMSTLQKKPAIQQLFERVLFIWSMRHPASGYVQGINDLLTPFFVVFLSEYINVDLNTAGELTLASNPSDMELESVEADCYWCVSRLLDSIQDHYTFAQPGIQNNVALLARLIDRLDSELAKHLSDHRVEYLQFAFRWMNNLLMRELPLRCIIRLWDTYHAEKDGFSHFHLYVCAAFLLKFAVDLKRERDFQGLLLMLQNLPTYHWTDDDVSMVLAEAYRLQCLFAEAPNHLDKSQPKR